MRHVVVKPQIMVNDCEIHMIGLQEVLEGSGAFVWGGLDIVNFD
jgi:hypothetical protein